MSNAPQNEHEKRDDLHEDVYYPEHSPRTESAEFVKTKAAGHAANTPCAISGRRDAVEYHHFFLEWAFSDAVDWALVKQIALEQVTELPVLDPITDLPTADTYPVKDSLIWSICKLAEMRGMHWEDFDPAKPEMFVDSMANMLVLDMKFHRSATHGIHMMTFPEWIFHAWPRKGGFAFTPDEVTNGLATAINP